MVHVSLVSYGDCKPFGPMLCGELYYRPDIILLDLGAACSLISSNFVPDDVSPSDTYNVHLNANDGTSMVFKGKITLP